MTQGTKQSARCAVRRARPEEASTAHGAPRTAHASALSSAPRLALAACGLLLAAGCGPKTVATINGSPITRDEFYSRILSFTRGTQPQIAAGLQILQGMMVERLILDEAKREGV